MYSLVVYEIYFLRVGGFLDFDRDLKVWGFYFNDSVKMLSMLDLFG